MSVPDGWKELDFDGMFDHLEAHFTQHVGPIYIRGSLERGDQQLGFEVQEHMCNPAGICHGGMLMTVMDVGLAFVLHNHMGGARFTPSVSFNFDFLAPGQLVGKDGPVITGSGIFKITNIVLDANHGAQAGMAKNAGEG